MLTANENNKTFHQYISAQFKPNTTKKLEVKNKGSFKPTKEINISGISPPISPRLSKKVLEKSKFYKEKDKVSES